MTISSLSGVSGLPQSQNISNASAKLQAVISSIVSGQADGADLSLATQLQAQTSGLRQASSNLAQGASLTQVASGGAQQIQAALQQLKSLAESAASPTLNDADRAALNQQFKATVNTIDQIATGTSFNGKNLLNGSLSGNDSLTLDSLLGASGSGGGQLSIPSLASSNLLAGSGDILSASDAGQAVNNIDNAISQVSSTVAGIGAFQQTLDFTTANVDSALFNQQAATSTLSDTDITTASTQKAQDTVQLNAAIAVAAQGNKLTPALLKLVA